MYRVIVIILLILPLHTLPSAAQQAGVKTNLLYWATTTPNLGVEIALGPKLTLDVAGAYNPWRFGAASSNRKIQHWLTQAEVRFWPYERWDGHFLGIHTQFLSYNAGGVNLPVGPLKNLRHTRYEGYATGVGFSYGYQWYLSPHWNLEATAGMGYTYHNYKRYECVRCGELLGKGTNHWFGPTRLGVSFIYLIRQR